jgi:hypothetical protein
MWAEVELDEIDGNKYILRYEEQTGEWTGGTEKLRIQAASASAGIPAADARLARTAAQRVVRELGGRIVALGEWPWPEDGGIAPGALEEAARRGIIVG